MKIPTTKDLEALKGVAWADKPSDARTSGEILHWACASELASFIELSPELENIHRTCPDSMIALRGSADFFDEIGEPLPRTLAFLLLRLERLHAGLPEG